MTDAMWVFANVGSGVAVLYGVYRLPLRWATGLTFGLFVVLLIGWAYVIGLRHGIELAIEQAIASGAHRAEDVAMSWWPVPVEQAASQRAQTLSNRLGLLQALMAFAPFILVVRRAKGETLFIADTLAKVPTRPNPTETRE